MSDTHKNPPQKFWHFLYTPVTIRDGHDNFFTPLRLLMAVLVMIGHTYVITLGNIDAEPHIFFEYSFSYVAVNLFFIASGFLVTKSILYRGNLAEYSSARLLRIYPALIVHVIFVMLVVGIIAKAIPIKEYLTHLDVWKQPLLVLSFIDTDVILPGVFLNNEEPFASVPLWTLRYEVMAYIATAIVFSLGLMKHKWMLLAQFILPCLAWVLTQHFGIYDQLISTLQNTLRFGIAYGLGATIYAYRDRLTFNFLGLIIAIILGIIFAHSPFREVTLNLMMGYGLMFFAYISLPKLKGLQTLSDVSYGVYIYHWCILQLIAHYLPEIGHWTLFVIALPITFAIAHASWHWVEKPMLKAKPRFAQWLRFGRPPSPKKQVQF